MLKKMICLLFSLAALTAAALPVKEITDESIKSGQIVTWKADTVYLLKGIVYVDSGATLNIDSGTIVKAYQEEGSSTPTCLVVAQYGKIFANGTKTKPIIFTAAADDPSNPFETTFEKVDNRPKGLWGGVVVFGNAKYNGAVNSNTLSGIGREDKRGFYGKATSPIINENSGVLRYVSIRYAGYNSEMITQLDYGSNYLAGLTLGGVGSGTVVEYIDVYNCLQDGIQILGGSVNCKYLSSTFNARNGFYCADGWDGCGQYWFSNAGGTGQDGAVHRADSVSSAAIISNVTYLYHNSNAGINVFNNASVHYFNAIVNMAFRGFNIETAQKNFANGNVSVNQSIFAKIGDQGKVLSYDKQIGLWIHPTSSNTVAVTAVVRDSMIKWGDSIVYPKFKSELNSNDFASFPPAMSSAYKGFDYRPEALVVDSSFAIRNCIFNPSTYQSPKFNSIPGFIEKTAFIGAFNPWQDTSWLRGWTAVDHYGYLSKNDIRTTSLAIPTKDCVSSESRINSKKMADKLNLNYYVNNSQLKVSIELKTAIANLEVMVYDLKGRFVGCVYRGNVSDGTHAFSMNTNKVVSGQYILRVNAKNASASKVISIVK